MVAKRVNETTTLACTTREGKLLTKSAKQENTKQVGDGHFPANWRCCEGSCMGVLLRAV